MNLSRFVINVQGIGFKCIFFDMHDELLKTCSCIDNYKMYPYFCVCASYNKDVSKLQEIHQKRYEDFYFFAEFYTTSILRFLLNYYYVVVYTSIQLYRYLYNYKNCKKSMQLYRQLHLS